MIRKNHHYPPFYYLSLITVSHDQLMTVVAATEKIVNYVRSQVSSDAVVLGPAASPIPRINNRYRYQCLIKYKREPNLTKMLKTILDQYQKDTKSGLLVSIDVNPFILM